MNTPKTALFLSLPMLVLLASCGGPPAPNAMLVDAKAGFAAAESNAQVVQLAPVELKEAEESLIISNRLWEAREDKTKIEHHAYISLQKTKIAQETALRNAALREMEQGEVERQKVLLDVRRAEAERSERTANSALLQAQQERVAAVAAGQRAESSSAAAAAATATAAEATARAAALSRRVAELEARPTERGLVLTLGDVLFDTGKSTLRSGGTSSVYELAKFLTEYPERNILIEGFTDNTGSVALNQNLSTQRADAVRQLLQSRGISSSRIRTIGYGINHPVGNNATAEGRSQNRRVEIVISDENGVLKDRTN
ncbi:MAG: OmpA family protein [Deltaproteobacteria bacterium]|nr:OmpA family protein [Deltaproteobacteria bacterium]